MLYALSTIFTKKCSINYSSKNDFYAWSGVPTYLVNEPKTKTTYVFLSYSKAKKFVDLKGAMAATEASGDTMVELWSLIETSNAFKDKMESLQSLGALVKSLVDLIDLF